MAVGYHAAGMIADNGLVAGDCIVSRIAAQHRDARAEDGFDAGQDLFFMTGRGGHPDLMRRFEGPAGIFEAVSNGSGPGGSWIPLEKPYADPVIAFRVMDSEQAENSRPAGNKSVVNHDPPACTCPVRRSLGKGSKKIAGYMPGVEKFCIVND